MTEFKSGKEDFCLLKRLLGGFLNTTQQDMAGHSGYL